MLPTLKLAVDMLLAIFLMAFSVDRSRAVIHIYAASNKTMVLECPLNKTAETQIVWLKNNQTLKFNSRISLFEKHGLKISALNYDDDGEYTCVSGDNKTSEPKQLQVTSKPKIQIQEPFRKHVREGVNVIRKCRSHGIPRPTVEWFTNRHQRVNISDNSTSLTARMNVVETIDGNTTLVTLTILPVLYSDNGVFTCIASNRHSTVMESSRVDVRYSPKMTSLFNTTTRVVHWWETAVVNLTCTADGNPFPTITWSSEAEDGDSVLNCSNEERIAESTIARSNCWIRSVNSSYQGGNYSCFAENNLGKTLVHSFVVQRIYPPPPVQFRLAEVTSKAFIMEVHVPRDDDSPPPRYVKIKYRATTGNFKHEFMSEIDENGNSNISLPGISPRKHYEISMAAVNKAGYGLWTSTIQESGDMLPTTTTTQKIPSYNITKNDHNSSAQVNNPRNASSSATSSWLSVILSLVLTAAGCQLTFHKKLAFLRHCDFLLDFKKNDFNET